MGHTMSHFDLTRRSKKHWTAVVALCVLALIWSVRLLGPKTKQVKILVFDNVARPYYKSSSVSRVQQLDLSHLQHIVRTPIFEYSRRVIQTQHYKGDRPDLTRVNETLTSPAIEAEKAHMSAVVVPNLPPLTLRVPISPKMDMSIFSIGIATTIPRLRYAIPQISHWLPNSQAQLHVLAPSRSDISSTQLSMRHAFMNVTITSTDDITFAQSYFSLIKKLYEERGPNTRWLVLADDDTFFPSLASLAQHFTQMYDHRKQLLVSATTDNLGQIYAFGLLPFGGGGIFISLPLAERLLVQAVFDKCVASATYQGDQMVNDCLNNFTDIKPTFDPLLHQMDIRGEPPAPEAGYFESGRRMLSVHHWRSWYDFDVEKGGNISLAIGDEGVFQRWLFDDNIVLPNGYSIAEYPQTADGAGGITEEELSGVEYTWNEGNQEEMWRYLHKMGPLRPKKGAEEKRSAHLVEAVEVLTSEGKGVRQVYIEKAENNDPNGNPVEEARDRIVELLWLS